jgi:hypothetical protein
MLVNIVDSTAGRIIYYLPDAIPEFGVVTGHYRSYVLKNYRVRIGKTGYTLESDLQTVKVLHSRSIDRPKPAPNQKLSRLGPRYRYPGFTKLLAIDAMMIVVANESVIRVIDNGVRKRVMEGPFDIDMPSDFIHCDIVWDTHVHVTTGSQIRVYSLKHKSLEKTIQLPCQIVQQCEYHVLCEDGSVWFIRYFDSTVKCVDHCATCPQSFSKSRKQPIMGL